MSSIITTLLFKRFPDHRGYGRLIKFDQTEAYIKFATGCMHERVIGYMGARAEPLTAGDIAHGIGSTTNRVYSTLKKLVQNGKIVAIQIEGAHPEYILNNVS